MEKLLNYFMAETDKKFDAIRGDLHEVKGILNDLTRFKAEMVASARLTSMLVSAACGLVTLTVSVWVALRAKQ